MTLGLFNCILGPVSQVNNAEWDSKMIMSGEWASILKEVVMLCLKFIRGITSDKLEDHYKSQYES
jgi:hypothetical protein